MSHEFNFSKFHRQHREEELPSKDEIIGLASIVVPPTDPLEQYLLDHENDMYMKEREEIDEVFFKQGPILKHNLPVEILGDPPPPKGDLVFELKPLPDTLKYAYLDEKKISLQETATLPSAMADGKGSKGGRQRPLPSAADGKRLRQRRLR